MAARHGIHDPAALAASGGRSRLVRAAGAEYVGLVWMRPYETVVDLSRGVERPRFFAGGQLNWADYAVDRWIREGRGQARAVWWESDDGVTPNADLCRAQGPRRRGGRGSAGPRYPCR